MQLGCGFVRFRACSPLYLASLQFSTFAFLGSFLWPLKHVYQEERFAKSFLEKQGGRRGRRPGERQEGKGSITSK